MSMKNSNDTIGNRTRDLPVHSAVPQPTAPPLAAIVGWQGPERLYTDNSRIRTSRLRQFISRHRKLCNTLAACLQKNDAVQLLFIYV
jgi:hypothetical protein